MLFQDIKIIDENFTAQEHMYVRTEGGRITYIGKDCPAAIEGEEVYDGRRKVMMPGLYNVHCHVPMTLLRGYGDGLPLQRWLTEKIFPFEAKLTAEDVYWSTQLGAMELIAGGSVSVSDMYFFINDMARALDECGMKANLCHGISSFDPDAKLKELPGYRDTLRLAADAAAGVYGGTGKTCVSHGTGADSNSELNPDVSRDSQTVAAEAGGDPAGMNAAATESRIKADMGLHAEYTTTEPFVRQVAEAAAEEQMTVHVHVSETEAEHRECRERHGGRTPVQYFADCGLFRNKVQAAHCVYLEDADVEIMKAAGAVAVHNPSSNLKLGSGMAPVRSFLDRGLSVALGTDGASSNNNLNMMEEMHMAAMIARGLTRDANAVSAADILKMASYEGALAQGRRHAGKIAVGWCADLVIVDTDNAHMQPDYQTVSNLVFSAQSSDIVLVMTDGRVIYKNGEYASIDRERVIYEVNRSFRRILKEL